MEKFLIIIVILTLGLSMILFTGHFIKHGISGSLRLSGLLKGAIISFIIYVITFLSYLFILN
ncbi:MAG TPA: hypothetical protein VIG73_05640 [Cerasibacillus sp.]|uniref:hypothetical protein n=1 Tax=Cerasibacillus sp. TaxID=2498711 RepID=UPI002F3EF942